MEALFEVLLTGAEIEALLVTTLPPDPSSSHFEGWRTAREKLVEAFTIVESAGGC